MSPSAIRDKTRGQRVRCRFRSINAHVEQERPELSLIGNRKGLWKSDDGFCSQWRSANKRRRNRVCQRIGFIRDSKASWRYTGRSLSRKTLQRSRIILRVDNWPEARAHQIWQTDKMRHGGPCTDRCPWSIDRLFKLSYICISNIFTAGSRNSHTASRINKKSESTSGSERVWRNPSKNEYNERVRGNPLRDLPEWLEECTENFVDGSVPEHQDAPASSSFGDFITADHRVLHEGCESRNNDRYAVVVQDLPTQWIQSYPCKTETSQENRKEVT